MFDHHQMLYITLDNEVLTHTSFELDLETDDEIVGFSHLLIKTQKTTLFHYGHGYIY